MKTLNILFVAVVAYFYASFYWLGIPNMFSEELAFKPFVYRQLVPILVHLISSVGIPLNYSVIFIVVCSGIGFYLALRELFFVFYEKNNVHETLIAVFVVIGLLLFQASRKPYDLMTAFLFTLSLLLMAQKKWTLYFLLFPLVCLNRETAILLSLFLFARNRNFTMLFLQTFMWLSIKTILTIVFSHHRGVVALVEPAENLQRFWENYFTTILHLSVIVVLLFFVVKDWKQKPPFLTVAFLVFAPLLFVMYIVFGQAFEVRVFWEVYPLVAVLSIPTVMESILSLRRFQYEETSMREDVRAS